MVVRGSYRISPSSDRYRSWPPPLLPSPPRPRPSPRAAVTIASILFHPCSWWQNPIVIFISPVNMQLTCSTVVNLIPVLRQGQARNGRAFVPFVKYDTLLTITVSENKSSAPHHHDHHPSFQKPHTLIHAHTHKKEQESISWRVFSCQRRYNVFQIFPSPHCTGVPFPPLGKGAGELIFLVAEGSSLPRTVFFFFNKIKQTCLPCLKVAMFVKGVGKMSPRVSISNK